MKNLNLLNLNDIRVNSILVENAISSSTLATIKKIATTSVFNLKPCKKILKNFIKKIFLY